MVLGVHARGLRRDVGDAHARHVAAARSARDGVAEAFARGDNAQARILLQTARHHERAVATLTSIRQRIGDGEE